MNHIKEKLCDPYVQKKVAIHLVLALIILLISLSLAYNTHQLFSGGEIRWFDIILQARALSVTQVGSFFMIYAGLGFLSQGHLIFTQNYIKYRSVMQTIAGVISLPKAEGQGQYGTARFLTQKELKQAFYVISRKQLERQATPKGGQLLGMSRDQAALYIMDEDTHCIVIGATRCGKTRCDILQTICITAMSGESMVMSDPKAELYHYTAPYLESLGYEVITLDFINPEKSNQYNFLQPIIDALNQNRISRAISAASEMANSLAPSGDRGEPIWTDGERAILASAILSVVYDNRDKPQFQNLTNVYHFIGKMCKPDSRDVMPLTPYLLGLADTHPAKALIDISEVAPSKMRGSFYTSALVALKEFTTPELYDMTRMTDFDFYATGRKKRAIFIILPDQKNVYDPIASLFVYQHYQVLVDESNRYGGRLPLRVNFILDEFGNFTKIPDFSKAITVGGGRGLRYVLVLQDFNQLTKIYGQEEGKIIRTNCETWLYLQSDNEETLKELSSRLGNYTIKSPSLSASTGGQSSASYNFTGRELLTTDEIEQIRRPYQLVFSRNRPIVLEAPDVAQTMFNDLLGLGDKDHNKALILKRSKLREVRPQVRPEDIALWGIWKNPAGNLLDQLQKRNPTENFGGKRK